MEQATVALPVFGVMVKSGMFSVIVCSAVLLFPQASVTVYVLVKVFAQVLLTAPSLLVTVRFALDVQLSLMVSPLLVRYAMVFVAAGASA